MSDDHAHTHEHTHLHTHDHGHDHGHEHGPGHEHDHDHEHCHEHVHTHSHEHTHEGEHNHSHEHTGSGHSHEHEHTHSHEHSHGGEHSHEHGGGDVTKLKALLQYMVDHNRDHAVELGDLAHKLRHTGQHESADLIQEAVKDFGKVNDQLAKALDLVKGGK